MLATEAEWFEQRLAAVETALHAKLDLTLRVLHHILNRSPAMDHAELLALAKTVDADADTAVTNFQALATTHATVTDALDDVGDVLKGIPAKLAKIVGSTATGQAQASDPSAPITATVTSATTAPATVITVAPADAATVAAAVDAATAAGTTVSAAGPGLPSAAIVTAADPAASTITLSAATPTIADHTGDGSEQITITPATAS